VPGYAGTSWFSFAAPRSVPANVIEKLNRDAQRAFAEPEVAARLAALA